MKFGVKLFLSTAVLGGLVGVYFADESLTAKKEQQKQENAVALYFNNTDCTKFSMQNTNGIFVFERENSSSPWQMNAPKNLMADQDAVNSILVMLRNISVQRSLEPNNNLANYGLATPNLRFELTFKGNSTKVLTLGKNLNENAESAFQLPSAYAQTSGRSNILVVDNSSLASFNEKTYADFRTKQVANFKYSDVANIVIQSANVTQEFDAVTPQLDRGAQSLHIALTQEENVWSATAPQSTAADNNFILKYIQIFQELTANNVIESPVEDILKTNGVNLQNPAATISFQNPDGQSLQEFSVYMTKSGLFINMPDGAFAQVDLDKWPALVPKFKHFRNRNVLLGTNAQCPNNLNNLIADDVLDNTSNIDLQNFGFQKPIQTFACSIGEKNSKTLDILIGNRVPLDEKSVYVKRSDADTVYIVNSELLSRLAQSESL